MGEDFPQEFGPYTLHELINRGGMAAIYRATMPGIGGFEKTVAIKKILPHLAEDEQYTTMLSDEARIIESLDHSNIAQVYDLGKLEDTYYIAMEYIHGIDVADVVEELGERGEYVPIPHVVHILASICDGLHYAHSQTDENGEPLNIVHRDVSLHNVIISFAGEVKIIDFGVAKGEDRDAKTQAGVVKGKLLYMAPEQAKADDVDGRADLFAAGLCTYKMLTGELPFEGDNEYEIYNNVLNKEIVPPGDKRPDVPEELDRIVMKLLERDLDQRYQDGYSVKKDLDKLLHSIDPGYTSNRLREFIEENFSHLAGGDEETEQAEETKQASPGSSDLTPGTPANQQRQTDQRGPDALDGAADVAGADATIEEPARGGVGDDIYDEKTVAEAPAGLQQEGPDSAESSPSESADSGGSARAEETALGPAAADQTVEETDESSLPPVVYAIVAVVVLIAGMIGYAVYRPSSQGSATNSGGGKSIAEAAGEDGMVSIELRTDPSKAKLVRKGEVVGRTPMTLPVPAAGAPLEITIRKAGYETKSIQLGPKAYPTKTVRLSPAIDPAATGGTSGSGSK
ncbi:MAG: serine/threonine protein kinase [Bradymonadaceae bacterium]